MINNSVSNAYLTINSLSEQVEKAEVEGIPKMAKDKAKKKNDKKGLLSRSREMFKNEEDKPMVDSTDKQQQKLVIAYVLRIRKAFEEVKDARTANTKS
tara:strand:- start:284 stop:577 length:294 start_codon:yes stop_codon:yes gene_type:complete